jgi:DNA-binding LytR/AlgR family response regulator
MKKTNVIFGIEQMVIYGKSTAEIINYKDIICITYDTPYLRLCTIGGKDKLLFYTLKELIQQLPSDFVLCSRSAIVHWLYVDGYYYVKEKKLCFNFEKWKHYSCIKKK